jgi:hypothetical protein
MKLKLFMENMLEFFLVFYFVPYKVNIPIHAGIGFATVYIHPALSCPHQPTYTPSSPAHTNLHTPLAVQRTPIYKLMYPCSKQTFLVRPLQYSLHTLFSPLADSCPFLLLSQQADLPLSFFHSRQPSSSPPPSADSLLSSF